MTYEAIAKICHEANKAYCESQGDTSQKSWDDADQWQRDSMISGVRYKMIHPLVTPEGMHAQWLDRKEREGWRYGPIKDASKKEHPCFMPYRDLPEHQKVKDFIFSGICEVLLKARLTLMEKG
jgi:RyR domain